MELGLVYAQLQDHGMTVKLRLPLPDGTVFYSVVDRKSKLVELHDTQPTVPHTKHIVEEMTTGIWIYVPTWLDEEPPKKVERARIIYDRDLANACATQCRNKLNKLDYIKDTA